MAGSNFGTAPIRLTRWNGELKPGDTALITGESGKKLTEIVTGSLADLKDCQVLVFGYDTSAYRYRILSNTGLGEDKSSLVLPDDGFAVAIHKLAESGFEDTRTTPFRVVNAANLRNAERYETGKIAMIAGISPLQLHWEISSVSSAPSVDGEIKSGEYGDPVVTINRENPIFDYSMHTADKYPTGTFYAAYDIDNLYFAWEIFSEDRSNNLTMEKSADMWTQSSLQVIISAMNPNHSQALDEALGWSGSPSGCGVSAYDWNAEIGIGANNDNQLIYHTWWGDLQNFEVKVVRDDAAGKTIYELRISRDMMNDAFADNQIDEFKAGLELGFSFTVNTNDGSSYKVLPLRSGGGIWWVNDFSQLTTLVLK